jgi:glutaredoxin
MAHAVIVYTSNNCAPCEAVKAFLGRHAVAFETRNVSENPAFIEELRALNTLATPCVVVDGTRVRGFDPARLSELLGFSR